MKRALVITAAALVALAIAGGLVFAYGTPQQPDVTASAVAPGEAAVVPGAQTPADGAAADEPAPATEAAPALKDQAVPEPDPSVPLAIEIPGCVCHSDDPKVVKEHSEYRMNQCAGCHAGDTPTGM